MWKWREIKGRKEVCHLFADFCAVLWRESCSLSSGFFSMVSLLYYNSLITSAAVSVRTAASRVATDTFHNYYGIYG